MLKTYSVKTFLVIALLFQIIDWLHDGWFVAKACQVMLLFTLTFIIGRYIYKNHTYWLPWLLGGLVIGLIIGTIVHQYTNPNYPLWATYGMSYANQAAGFAITIGLLSLSTKKWWLILPIILGMFLYLYMTGERASVFALSLACIILITVIHRYRLLIILLSMIVVGFFYLNNTADLPNKNNNVRFNIWHHGILIAEHDMFLGRGEHHEFTQSELDLYKTYATGPGKKFLEKVTPLHPDPEYNASYHNQFIQYLVEYGAIGLLIFLFFLIVPIIQGWTYQSLNMTQLSFIMLWTAFFVHCVFETGFDADSAIILGLLAGLMNMYQNEHPYKN